MRRSLRFFGGIRNRGRKSNHPHDRDVGEVITNEAAFIFGHTGFSDNGFQGRDLVLCILMNVMHVQFARAPGYRFRPPARNYSALVTGAMPKGNPLPVARVKSFLLVAVGSQPDPAISQHAVAIHQKKLDALGARSRVASFEFEG
jgi:hypothetical protein